jgi:ABC-type sulfate transport system substrate-binding protein
MMKYLKIQNKLVCVWEHLEGRIKAAALSFVVLILILALFIGGRTILANDEVPIRLVVYAFSTQEEVLSKGILPAFEKAWEAQTGREIEIEAVFGPSGTLAGQINLGAPADVAIFSNAHHVNWLKFGRMVRKETQPSIIGYTPMVIVTRPGNPHDIFSYADLAQPNLRLLHADPRSSGAGEWSLLAEYGSALLESSDPDIAEAQLQAIWSNVRLLEPSARATLTLFELGAGDALITYEQDARLAQERGVPLEIIVPPRTIIAQHVAVVVDENITRGERPVVKAFMDYLLSEAGQQILSSYHMRPVNLVYEGFPPITQPFTVEDLSGWSHAYTEFVNTLWREEIEPGLDLDPSPMLITPGE